MARAGDADRFDDLRDVLESVVRDRTRKHVAYELDVGGSQLSESFAGDNKQLQLRWLPTFVRLASPTLRAELLAVLLDMFDDQEEPLTTAEEQQAKDETLAFFGDRAREILQEKRQAIRRSKVKAKAKARRG